MTFSFDGAPEGAEIDSSTGFISWTATALGDITFIVRVTDGAGLFSTQEFVLPVVEEHIAPTVTAGLQFDSAPANTTNDDLVTFDPTIVGTVSDVNGTVERLEASFDGESITVPVREISSRS